MRMEGKYKRFRLRYTQEQSPKDLGPFLQDRSFQGKRQKRYRAWAFHCQRDPQFPQPAYQCDQHRRCGHGIHLYPVQRNGKQKLKTAGSRNRPISIWFRLSAVLFLFGPFIFPFAPCFISLNIKAFIWPQAFVISSHT